jgi:hypothetical protein
VIPDRHLSIVERRLSFQGISCIDDKLCECDIELGRDRGRALGGPGMPGYSNGHRRDVPCSRYIYTVDPESKTQAKQ